MASLIRTIAAALAGALVGLALSASAAQFTKNSGGSSGGVSRAEFERLSGQVQAIEGRVAALERMSGHGHG
jgi:outer membrane murein-binding lipoprotein Lpp